MTKETQELDTFLLDDDIKIPWYRNVYYYFYRKTSNIRYNWQRLRCFFIRGKKGYSYIDLWSFDAYICKMMISGLNEFIENLHGYPADFDGNHEDPFVAWRDVLVEMREGFEAGQKIVNSVPSLAEYERLEKKFNKGIDLFKHYFFNLWD